MLCPYFKTAIFNGCTVALYITCYYHPILQSFMWHCIKYNWCGLHWNIYITVLIMLLMEMESIYLQKCDKRQNGSECVLYRATDLILSNDTEMECNVIWKLTDHQRMPHVLPISQSNLIWCSYHNLVPSNIAN